MLTAKEQAFVAEYLKCRNATEATKRAGYSPKTAKNAGHNLLQRPDVAAAVKAGQDAMLNRAQVSADQVVAELVKIAFGNMQDFVEDGNIPKELKDMDRDLAGIVQEVGREVKTFKGISQVNQKVRLYNKLDALEKLGRHLGIFEKDNLSKNVIIKVEFMDDDDDDIDDNDE